MSDELRSNVLVATASDPDSERSTAIARGAEDVPMAGIVATERGLRSRLVRGSPVLDVVDDVDCSVLLAEKARTRSLRECLFGQR